MGWYQRFHAACFVAALVLLGACCSPISAQTVAYYTFSNGTPGAVASGTGTILDNSGNGFNGTPYHSPVYSSNVPNTPFPTTVSLQGTGSGQGVSVPDAPALAITQNLTVEAYVDVTAVHQQPYGQVIVIRGDDRAGLDPYFLQVLGEGASPSVFQFDITNGSNVTASVQTPIPAFNQWMEVAGTLNNTTGALDIYINGILEASTTTAVRPLGTLDGSQDPGLGIGGLQDPNQNSLESFNGLISDVRISNQALTPSQMLVNGVPEPATASILFIGGAMALLRRGRGSARR